MLREVESRSPLKWVCFDHGFTGDVLDDLAELRNWNLRGELLAF